MLSYTCQTAVRAVVFLATKDEGINKVSVREIAEQVNASEHTVGKLLQTLVRNGIINSLKGPCGGFYITKDQKAQRIISVILAIDGNNAFRKCGLGFNTCSASHPCPIHNEYKKTNDVLERLFKTKTVMDLTRPVKFGKAYLFG